MSSTTKTTNYNLPQFADAKESSIGIIKYGNKIR